ncbi:MAG: DNA-methyltransferase [Candidatus Puniceispirillales bacterium]
MDSIPDDSVALTVTSPPYWNAIDYDVFSVSKRDENYRTRKYSNGFDAEEKGYQEYLDWCNTIFDEVYRVTKPGGFCAIVIGTILFKGRYYAAPHDLLNRLTHQEPRWQFHQDIVWNKVTGGIKRAGVAIQKPYPGYYYPNIMTEYIHVLKKPGDPIYKGLNGEKQASEYPIDDLFKRDVANNIWHIAPVPPGMIDHPCPFPEEIPDRLITLYSYKNDTVLDPFLGSGQTAKVALALGRNCIGYDVEKSYVSLAEQRISEPSRIRKQQLIPRFAKVSVDRGGLF